MEMKESRIKKAMKMSLSCCDEYGNETIKLKDCVLIKSTKSIDTKQSCAFY